MATGIYKKELLRGFAVLLLDLGKVLCKEGRRSGSIVPHLPCGVGGGVPQPSFVPILCSAVEVRVVLLSWC